MLISQYVHVCLDADGRQQSCVPSRPIAAAESPCLCPTQDKLVKTIVANYVLWPGAHFINFRFVPSEHRILCASLLRRHLLRNTPCTWRRLALQTSDLDASASGTSPWTAWGRQMRRQLFRHRLPVTHPIQSMLLMTAAAPAYRAMPSVSMSVGLHVDSSVPRHRRQQLRERGVERVLEHAEPRRSAAGHHAAAGRARPGPAPPQRLGAPPPPNVHTCVQAHPPAVHAVVAP